MPGSTFKRGGSALALALGFAGSASAQQYGILHSVTSHVFRPAQVPATEERIASLAVPDGFSLGVFARDVGNVRMMAMSEDGALYLTRPGTNDVIVLKDEDGDGSADGAPEVVASDLKNVHGIAIQDGRIHLATIHEVHQGQIQDDGSIADLEAVVDDLPGGGQHARRTLEFGPDGKLFLQIGSSCNACVETDEENAAILEVDPSDWSRRIFANGVRNTMGFDWHPESGEMWGADHGTDWRGDEVPPDELNRLTADGHYGWPFCYGEGEPDYLTYAMPPGADSKEAWCERQSEPMVMALTAHSAPIDFVFYDAEQFPEDYRGDAFVTLRGSWNREEPAGYAVVRVRFEDGEPTEVGDFLHRFLTDDGEEHFGRVAGLLVANDGSLLVSEDTNGVIYRISHTEGTQQARTRQ